MKFVVPACAVAAALVCATAAPASATFERPGVCADYGSIPLATVYDPTRPGQPLVQVSAPTVHNVYFC